MLDFLARLQTMDRRWIYLFVAIACTIPFIRPVDIDVYVSPETQAYYDAVQSVPKDKIVLVDSPWGPGSVGENKGQTEALFEHLLRNRQKFVVFALDGDALAPSYTDDIIKKLIASHPEFKDIEYGVDWVNLGITKGGAFAMQLFAKDFKKQFEKDVKGHYTTDIPITKNLNNINDVGLLTSTNYWPSEDYIGFIHEVYGTKLVFGGGGISSTTIYRYMPSGQVAGFLVGARGGAEYDKLLHPNSITDRKNYGSKLILPLAYGHLVIIFAIVLGNIGYFAAKRKKANND
ncbi:MAG: hypothetical protein NT018_05670 [Armatimonadetes bacterium]|nr:hypothetical protein [Armatimonadota bacterium]